MLQNMCEKLVGSEKKLEIEMRNRVTHRDPDNMDSQISGE